jgi:hypothetical protein
MAEILQVLPLIKSNDNVLKCHKKKRTPTETIHKLTKEDIGAHSGRLGVKSYEEYYQTTLKAEVKRQYQVQGLQGMLLSP